MENFFSNEEITYLFESNAFAMFTMERIIAQHEEKLKEMNGLTGSNPIAKALANIVSNATGRKESAEEILKGIKEGTSESGKKYSMMKSIVKSLSLPYYAITGHTLEEYKAHFEKNAPKTDLTVEDLIKSFL